MLRGGVEFTPLVAGAGRGHRPVGRNPVHAGDAAGSRRGSDLPAHARNGRPRLGAPLRATRAAAPIVGATLHDYNDRDDDFGFQMVAIRRHRTSAHPARNLGAVVPRPRPERHREGRPADPVLHAAGGRRRLVAARLQQLALPRPEQPAAAGRVAHHGQPLSRPGVLLRRRQGRREHARTSTSTT